MRKMMFGTLNAPGWDHYLECSHPNVSARAFGVSAVTASAWDADGGLVHQTELPLDEPLSRLPGPSDTDQTHFITIETTFSRDRNVHMYGYLHAGGSHEAAVYYPINPALGSRHTHVWDNVGHFVWGTRAPRYRLLFFAANPSRWATIEGTLTYLLMEGPGESRRIRLGPKQHVMLDLWGDAVNGEAGAPAGIEFVSSSKLVTYLVGQVRETGSVTFVEHLLERRR